MDQKVIPRTHAGMPVYSAFQQALRTREQEEEWKRKERERQRRVDVKKLQQVTKEREEEARVHEIYSPIRRAREHALAQGTTKDPWHNLIY